MTEDIVTLLANDTFRHMLWTVVVIWSMRVLIRAGNGN
jgi:hypothetical protein